MNLDAKAGVALIVIVGAVAAGSYTLGSHENSKENAPLEPSSSILGQSSGTPIGHPVLDGNGIASIQSKRKALPTISGASIPLLLKRFGADPALAGTVVLTTVTDIVGSLAFLGLATIYLL